MKYDTEQQKPDKIDQSSACEKDEERLQEKETTDASSEEQKPKQTNENEATV